VQECLTNVFGHSQSETAEVRIGQDDTSVSSQVQAHGRDMTDEELAVINKGGSGVGIRAMLNRVRQINERQINERQIHGEMKVESGESGLLFLYGCRSLILFP
jgi:signal transduction histidine kinase